MSLLLLLCWASISSHLLVTCVFTYYLTSTTHFLSRTSMKNSQHVCWSLHSTENPSLASTAECSKPLLYLSGHLPGIYFPKALESATQHFSSSVLMTFLSPHTRETAFYSTRCESSLLTKHTSHTKGFCWSLGPFLFLSISKLLSMW